MLTRFFYPPLVIGCWVALGALGVAAGVHYASVVHEARASRQRVCAAELAALKAGAFLRDVVAPSDPCIAVQIAATAGLSRRTNSARGSKP